MRVLLVSYDLKKPGRDYSGLYDTLKTAPSWWHYLESCWLLKTDLSPNDLWDGIRQHIDRNDYVLIIEVTSSYQGWLPEKAWDWINKNLV